MEFLKTIKKRRSLLSEITYVVLNVGLAVLLMIIIRTTGSLWLAFTLVIIGKWRIFAVRPRFWSANIQANLVSTTISIGYVVFLYVINSANASSGQILIAQSVLVLLDVGWLLFLKSQSKRSYMVLQAGIALFVGLVAIYNLSYGWIVAPVVLLTWLVGYSTARHVLSSYDEEKHSVLLSLVWGLLVAEIGWLAYHATIAYPLPFTPGLLIPQVSILLLSIGFLTRRAYDSFYHHQKIRGNDIVLPLIFTIFLSIFLLIVLPLILCGSLSCFRSVGL